MVQTAFALALLAGNVGVSDYFVRGSLSVMELLDGSFNT